MTILSIILQFTWDHFDYFLNCKIYISSDELIFFSRNPCQKVFPSFLICSNLVNKLLTYNNERNKLRALRSVRIELASNLCVGLVGVRCDRKNGYVTGT